MHNTLTQNHIFTCGNEFHLNIGYAWDMPNENFSKLANKIWSYKAFALLKIEIFHLRFIEFWHFLAISAKTLRGNFWLKVGFFYYIATTRKACEIEAIPSLFYTKSYKHSIQGVNRFLLGRYSHCFCHNTLCQ